MRKEEVFYFFEKSWGWVVHPRFQLDGFRGTKNGVWGMMVVHTGVLRGGGERERGERGGGAKRMEEEG
uniref:Uncharacterized protein n=1 Tax=Vespula pensylvanica TaxID=30213 RepID=A0A834P6D1_VESPE|nr:hypothetical protein H0235_006211 [Vespula pensylvanica]